MNKLGVTFGVVLGGVFMLYMMFKGTYNHMVALDEGVSGAWAQVESQYQRRYDLVPNLVETVKGAAQFEKETFQAVTEARATAGKTTVDVKDVESFVAFQANQTQFSSALSRLLVTMERYPDLKATKGFQDLQVQLEGTENRIATERMRFNDSAKNYNVYIRQFPNTVLAGWFGFERAQLFESVEGAKEAPAVQF